MVVMQAPEKASGLDGIEAGVYRAILKEVAVVTSKNPFAKPENDEPEERTQFEWKWALDQGDDIMEMPTIKSWTTASVHERSNTAKNILPALGITIPQPGEEYDTDDWLGKSCQVQLVEYTRGDGTTGVKIGGYLAEPRKPAKKLF
jgi:hypothetical protein